MNTLDHGKQPVGDVRDLWNLDRSFTFLNHGSYGATPKSIVEERYRLLLHIESEPVRYYSREIDSLLAKARQRLASFLGADPEGLVFVPNATTGVNTVLRSLHFRPGDDILVTDHVYNACNNAAQFVAKKAGANVVTVHIPFPIRSPETVMELVLAGITPRTRLVLIDHVTSPTALVFPIGDIIKELRPKGVEVMVDGAHAPGMLPLNLKDLGAAYYTGNCHKWLCAPKGSAFLYLREDVRSGIRPLTISHGANSARTDKSFLHLEFDWTGTDDYTPYALIPSCIDFLESLYPGGITELMARNYEMALWAMDYLCGRLDGPAPCPADMLGSMASVPVLPLGEPPPGRGVAPDPIHERLFQEFRIEVPIVRWPSSGRRLVRVSAQAYNTQEDYKYLAEALEKIM
jgi:isopenicillin-N epimerase